MFQAKYPREIRRVKSLPQATPNLEEQQLQAALAASLAESQPRAESQQRDTEVRTIGAERRIGSA